MAWLAGRRRDPTPINKMTKTDDGLAGAGAAPMLPAVESPRPRKAPKPLWGASAVAEEQPEGSKGIVSTAGNCYFEQNGNKCRWSIT
jgi:hypothetical protein